MKIGKGENQKITMDVSYVSLFKILVFFLLVAVLYIIRDLLLILLFSFILASALDPAVSFFERSFKFPRVFGVAIIYVLVLFVIIMAGVLASKPIAEQAHDLSASLPQYYNSFVNQFDKLIYQGGFEENAQSIGKSIQSFSGSLNFFAGNAVSFAKHVLGGGASVFLIMVLTFYFVVEDQGMKRFIRHIAPLEYQPYLVRMLNRVQYKMGQWFRGQLILSGVIFLASAIALLVLGIKYWLILALIAGMLEVIPFIGPVIAMIVAILFTVAISPFKALLIFFIYLGIQQLENNLLVPQIMKKAVGLNPIIIITVLITGIKLGGIIGGVISIPIAASVNLFIQDIFEDKKIKDSKADAF